MSKKRTAKFLLASVWCYSLFSLRTVHAQEASTAISLNKEPEAQLEEIPHTDDPQAEAASICFTFCLSSAILCSAVFYQIQKRKREGLRHE